MPSSAQASSTRYRVAKLSAPSMTRSYCPRISSASAAVSRTGWVRTVTWGLAARTRSRALSTESAASAAVCTTCRWRLLASTVSSSTTDGADARGGEVQQRRAAQAARADHEHARVLEPPLAQAAPHRAAPGGGRTATLGRAQPGGRLDQRREGSGWHAPSMPLGALHGANGASALPAGRSAL